MECIKHNSCCAFFSCAQTGFARTINRKTGEKADMVRANEFYAHDK